MPEKPKVKVKLNVHNCIISVLALQLIIQVSFANLFNLYAHSKWIIWLKRSLSLVTALKDQLEFWDDHFVCYQMLESMHTVSNICIGHHRKDHLESSKYWYLIYMLLFLLAI